MISNKKKNIYYLCLLFTGFLIYACNNSNIDHQFEFQKIDLDHIESLNFQDEFIDTLILNSNHLIHLHIPFKIDSLYKNSMVCGNESRFNFYKNTIKNITIEISQNTDYNLTYTNYQKRTQDSEQYKMTNRDSVHHQRHIDNYLNSYKNIFNHELENKVIVSQNFHSQNGNLWTISGNEIISSGNNRTVEIGCINIESFNSYTVFTVVKIYFVETELKNQETISNSIYICNRLFK